MVEIETGFQENTIGVVQQFADVAAADPLGGVMLAVGAVIMTVAIVVFGVLTLGSVLTAFGRWITSDPEPIQ